jgi:hypothetical protein
LLGWRRTSAPAAAALGRVGRAVVDDENSIHVGRAPLTTPAIVAAQLLRG